MQDTQLVLGSSLISWSLDLVVFSSILAVQSSRTLNSSPVTDSCISLHYPVLLRTSTTLHISDAHNGRPQVQMGSQWSSTGSNGVTIVVHRFKWGQHDAKKGEPAGLDGAAASAWSMLI